MKYAHSEELLNGIVDDWFDMHEDLSDVGPNEAMGDCRDVLDDIIDELQSVKAKLHIDREVGDRFRNQF